VGREVEIFVSSGRYSQILMQTSGPRRRQRGGDSDDDEEEELAPLRRAQALVGRLRRRDLYKFCHEVTIPPQHAENFIMPSAGGALAQTASSLNNGCTSA